MLVWLKVGGGRLDTKRSGQGLSLHCCSWLPDSRTGVPNPRASDQYRSPSRPITHITAWTITTPPSVGKLSSTKPVPGAKKVGDRASLESPFLVDLNPGWASDSPVAHVRLSLPSLILDLQPQHLLGWGWGVHWRFWMQEWWRTTAFLFLCQLLPTDWAGCSFDCWPWMLALLAPPYPQYMLLISFSQFSGNEILKRDLKKFFKKRSLGSIAFFSLFRFPNEV